MDRLSNTTRIIICCLITLSIFACNGSSISVKEKHKNETALKEENTSNELTPEEKAKKLAEYLNIKAKIKLKQEVFQNLYAKANEEKKKLIVIDARKFILESIAKDLFPYWYGTTWSFEGTTTEPGCGSVACGYFVTTILRDAGFDLPRVKWAQDASETLIRNVTDKKNIKYFIKTDITKVEAAIKTWGSGLYIAGLDTHVGFILNQGDSIRFVHSNYYDPEKGVCAQELNSNNPLKDSGYRVIGKILNDDMVQRWIQGKRLGPDLN